jgi:hypothetical protein
MEQKDYFRNENVLAISINLIKYFMNIFQTIKLDENEIEEESIK